MYKDMETDNNLKNDYVDSKYQEICAPQVDVFVYVTDNNTLRRRFCSDLLKLGFAIIDAF